jgi:hypothetical protein
MFTKIKTKKKIPISSAEEGQVKKVMNEKECKESKHKETREDGTLTWL